MNHETTIVESPKDLNLTLSELHRAIVDAGGSVDEVLRADAGDGPEAPFACGGCRGCGCRGCGCEGCRGCGCEGCRGCGCEGCRGCGGCGGCGGCH